VNIEPIAKIAMEFLKDNVSGVNLCGVESIGEIYEVEWETRFGEGRGSVFVTVEQPRIVGFKRLKQ